MKKLNKRVLSVFVLVVLLFSLAACTSEPAQGDEIGNRQIVNIWLPMTASFDIEWWNHQFELYNAESDAYYIKVSWVDSSAMDSKLLAARENGTAPDVVTYSIGGVAQKAQYGILTPLGDYIENLDAYMADFDEKIVENITALNGDIYGIPRFLEPSMLLYYRKDILADAGWPEPPKSMAELEQCCADVTAYLAAHSELKLSKTMQVASTNDDYGWVSWAVQEQVAGHVSALNADWTAADVSGFEKVAEYWADLHDFDGVAPQALTSGGYKDSYGAIFEGKVALQQCGSWIWGTLQSMEEYEGIRDKIGVAPWPTISGKTEGEVLCSVGGWSLAIDRGANCPEGAGDFIEWCLLSEASAQRLFENFEAYNYCRISPRHSVNDLILQASGGNNNDIQTLVIDVLLPHSVVEPTYPWEISQFLGNAYVAFVSGGKTAKEAIAAAEAEINAYIAQSGVTQNRFN